MMMQALVDVAVGLGDTVVAVALGELVVGAAVAVGAVVVLG